MSGGAGDGMVKKVGTALGWLGTALVFGSVAVRMFRTEWSQYAYWAAWAGLACVLLYMASQYKEIGESFKRRQTRLGTLAATGVLVVLAIVVAVNYLASRRNYRWDLTVNKQFSLSEQTRQILERLDAPVQVRVFARPDEFQRFRDRLDEYTYHSDRVKIEYIDLDQQPVLASQNQVQAYGTVVFAYKGRTERVVSSEEQELTNALIKLITGEERKVYFLSGHGEHDTESSERDGYSAIESALTSENYKVEKLVLLQQQRVPDDADVVVIAGPETDLFQPEIDALRAYLERGGKVLALVDPPAEANSPPLTNLSALLREFAIEVGNNVVVDASGVGQLIGTDASVPVATNYPDHPITQNFRLLTAFPLARSVAGVSGGVNGRTARNFIESSRNSWGESNIAELYASGKVENTPGQDLAGPVPLGAAMSMPAPNPPAPEPAQAKADASAQDAPAQAANKSQTGNGDTADDETAGQGDTDKDGDDDQPKPETRLAVIGDSDFAANFALGIQGNRDLFVNTVNWLAQQENLISIRPKDPEDRRISMTAGQQTAVRWLSLLILPALVFGAGIYSWMRRRE